MMISGAPVRSYLQVGNSSNGCDVRWVILQLGAGQTSPGATCRLRVVIIAEMTESYYQPARHQEGIMLITTNYKSWIVQIKT